MGQRHLFHSVLLSTLKYNNRPYLKDFIYALVTIEQDKANMQLNKQYNEKNNYINSLHHEKYLKQLFNQQFKLKQQRNLDFQKIKEEFSNKNLDEIINKYIFIVDKKLQVEQFFYFSIIIVYQLRIQFRENFYDELKEEDFKQVKWVSMFKRMKKQTFEKNFHSQIKILFKLKCITNCVNKNIQQLLIVYNPNFTFICNAQAQSIILNNNSQFNIYLQI
ncbi:hypothetical protein TTHERM_000670103 (macronuclear) [Tetrahymena thermophila SB210]|uniref:Uncharacterized protein n=1 Tax=Tetrahymena thermophila (strain SB210) TaxID=312017 RepID=W7XC91_TETTS|nr:hypothetical protein TTHERM_000670103 [Tetrahymena thermophila SB210]EWS71341.1 hypothetical protein TTHERM_000670103 [Tetrahymena thermophila SB210]|eukprot:XP_012656115.1 hypothetical protein TTHERM_000670103 [Tetrahymena thermophila SB210]